MGKGYRPGRLGEEIRRITSQLLLRELKDPRFSKGMVSISAVDVTDDSSYATLYVSVLGYGAGGELSEKEKEEILAAFHSARGIIRSEIGKQIKLRHVPELKFKMDKSMEYGRHMEEVIGRLGVKRDEEEAPGIEARDTEE